MAEYYLTAPIDNETTLYLAPLSDRRLELTGEELSDVGGYFLYTVRHTTQPETVSILARVHSDEAVWQFRRLFNLS